MPWEVKKQDGKWCVFKEGEDSPVKGGCHGDKEAAKKHMSALYASEQGKSGVRVIYKGGPLPIDDFSVSDSGETRITINDIKALTIPDGVSVEEYRDQIHEAWYKENEYRGWVCKTYDTYVIVHMDKKTWKVPYTYSDDGEIEFAPNNEWEQVKLRSEYVPVTKAALIDNLTIKSLGENRIGGYGILWGDESHKDVHGEFFTNETADMTEVFKALGALPWLFHHTMDKKLKSSVVGIIDKMEADDTGLWYEAKIREQELYKQYVKPLIDAKALFSSSGAYPGSKESDRKTGQITRWTIGEISGTHIPADYRQLDSAALEELKSVYKSVGLNTEILDRQDETETSDGVEQVGESEQITKGAEKARLEAEIQLAKSRIGLMEVY